jgi:hypothetical protein
MTRSTGVRGRKRRREQLFSAEIKLRRVLLHLGDAQAWARRYRDGTEAFSLWEAHCLVLARYDDAVSEQKELM